MCFYIFLVVVFFVKSVVASNKEDSFLCNEARIELSSLVNETLDKNEIPSDLLILTEKLNNSKEIINLVNCSKLLTLKDYLYNHILKWNQSDLPMRNYFALYNYIEKKLHNMTYFPHSNESIRILTNTFASTNLNSNLLRNVQKYFSQYSNWSQVLEQIGFPFEKYSDPRILLLDMICKLIFEHPYMQHEKDVIFFLFINKHVCTLMRKPTYIHLDKIGSNNETGRPLKLSLLNKTTNLNRSRNLNRFTMDKIIFFGNISFVFTDNEKPKNKSNFETNVSLTATITKIFETRNQIGFNSTIHNLTVLRSNFPEVTLHNQTGVQETKYPSLKMSIHNFLTISRDNSKKYVQSSIQNTSLAFGNKTSEEPNDSTNYYFIMSNFTVWDIVEIDGPCKEGQGHVVKLNIKSLLTTVDSPISNETLELLEVVLRNVKSFPIEDYNARGELLRDLLSSVLVNQTDPRIKHSIVEVLEHVLLDREGALPPKIKLECENVSEQVDVGNSRRKRLNIWFK